MNYCPDCGNEMEELKRQGYPIICTSEYMPFYIGLFLCKKCDKNWEKTWYKNWRGKEIILFKKIFPTK